MRPIVVPGEVVEQRPFEQIGWVPGLPARCEQGRAAHRDQRFLEQHFALQAVRDPDDEGDPDFEVAPCRIDLVVVTERGLELDGDLGVSVAERREPRRQPHFGKGLDGDEPERPGRLASAELLRRLVETGEAGLYRGEVGLS